jgi:hypothetical protein
VITRTRKQSGQPTVRIRQIAQALKSLGGRARVGDIYKEYARLYPERTTTTTWQAGLRNAMQRYNPDSSQYQTGNAHLFESPVPGEWALKPDDDQFSDNARDQAITNIAEAIVQIGAEANG